MKHTIANMLTKSTALILSFKFPMVTRTICSPLKTPNMLISNYSTSVDYIKSSHAKVITIYRAGGTDCLMEWTKTHTVKLSGFSNNFSYMLFTRGFKDLNDF